MRAFGIVGWSGSGKTTYLEGVIKALVADGLSVATIKHAHKRFDMDRPGKDSYRHRAAGARQVLVTSPDRWALLTETPDDGDGLSLGRALARLDPCDVVLVEGYRGAEAEKIEVWRAARGGAPLYAADPRIIAVASDVAEAALPAPLAGRPLLPLNRPADAASLIRDRIAHPAGRQEAEG